MLISVVVPTRDRARSLARCLGALAVQDAEVEIVVVDDGSRDRAGVEAAVARSARARLVRTSGEGPAAARNAGAAAATGEVVCFTDDDCEPAPGWAATLATATPATGVAAGRTVAPPDSTAPVLAAQAITSGLQLASLDPRTGALGFAPSCNLACAREAIGALPFDESFPHPGGEDRDWSARAVAAGHPPRYEPAAVVVHRPPLSIGSFLRQQFRYGRGASRFRRAAPDRPLAPPSFYAGLVREGFRHGAHAGALVCAAQATAMIGAGFERAAGVRAR